jgi:VanZ family protein
VADRLGARLLRAGWPALAWAAVIFILSHQSRPLPITPPITHFDKVLHAGAYCLLAVFAARALRTAGLAGRRALWITVVVASLYGASDELHQSFVPGRDPDPLDWAADTAGAVLGAALVVGLPRRRSRASIRG